MVLLTDLDVLSNTILFLDSSSLLNFSNCSKDARKRVQNDKIWLKLTLWHWKYLPLSQDLRADSPISSFNLFSLIRQAEIDVLKMALLTIQQKITMNEYSSYIIETIHPSFKNFILEFLCYILDDCCIMKDFQQQFSDDDVPTERMKSLIFLEHLGPVVITYIHRIKELPPFMKLLQYGYTLLKGDCQERQVSKIMRINTTPSITNTKTTSITPSTTTTADTTMNDDNNYDTNNIAALPMLRVIAEIKLFGCDHDIINDTVERATRTVWSKVCNNQHKMNWTSSSSLSSSVSNGMNIKPTNMPSSSSSSSSPSSFSSSSSLSENDYRALMNQINIIELMNAIIHVIMIEEKFSGNTINYHHLNNSYIDKVCQTKKGIPLTLCALVQAVALRVGIDGDRVGLIGFPGHVVLGVRINPVTSSNLVSNCNSSSNNNSSSSSNNSSSNSSSSSSNNNNSNSNMPKTITAADSNNHINTPSNYIYYDIFGWTNTTTPPPPPPHHHHHMTYTQLLEHFGYSHDLMLKKICSTFMTNAEIARRCLRNISAIRNRQLSLHTTTTTTATTSSYSSSSSSSNNSSSSSSSNSSNNSGNSRVNHSLKYELNLNYLYLNLLYSTFPTHTNNNNDDQYSEDFTTESNDCINQIILTAIKLGFIQVVQRYAMICICQGYINDDEKNELLNMALLHQNAYLTD